MILNSSSSARFNGLTCLLTHTVHICLLLPAPMTVLVYEVTNTPRTGVALTQRKLADANLGHKECTITHCCLVLSWALEATRVGTHASLTIDAPLVHRCQTDWQGEQKFPVVAIDYVDRVHTSP